MNDRRIANDILLKVEDRNAYSNLELSSVLSNEKSVENNAFVSALVYGVLERKLTLDYAISKHSKRRVRDIDKPVLNAMRMAVYQMFYMDSVPVFSAIDESVDIIKKERGEKTAGFANAVLRAISDDKNAIKVSVKDELVGISKAYSVSVDIVKNMVRDFGMNKTKAILKTTFGKPPLIVRTNTLKINDDELINALESEGVKAQKTDFFGAVEIVSTTRIDTLNAYKNGLFHVQDTASQICALALGAKQGDRVLDVCSAPGGKTFTIAESMTNGEIVSCDLYEHRVKLIKDGAERLGIDFITAIQNDATVLNDNLGLFDKILCDVVCSGTGVIRRKPEIRYKKSEQINELIPIQKSILETSSKYLKKGGILLYSTCSINSDENEKVCDEFLKMHGDFVDEPLFENDVITQKTFTPDTDKTDGFYIRKFKKI